jgi:ribosomal protein S27E
MQSKKARLFMYSAGALLLAAAMMMFIGVWVGTGHGLIHPRDPILGIPTSLLLGIVGGISLLTAIICLFGKRESVQAALVLLLAINIASYQAGLWISNISSGFSGYLGDESAAFHISPITANTIVNILSSYLCIGGGLSLLCLWVRRESAEPQGGFLKTACTNCGGHIKFASEKLGQVISCPHCEKSTKLRKSDFLKVACFFCREHIEFPTHAIGTKIRCPHCSMDITLKEPV